MIMQTTTGRHRRIWLWIAGAVVCVALAGVSFVAAAGGPKALGWGAITVSGDGSQRVPVELDADVLYVATVSHDGEGFSMKPLDRSGLPLIYGGVSHVGAYHGSVLFGMAEDPPRELEITARGAWKIEFRDAREAARMDGTATGTQETVVTLDAEAQKKSTLLFNCDDCGAPSVRAVSATGEWRHLDTPGTPLTTAQLPPNTEILEIAAYGSWTLRLS